MSKPVETPKTSQGILRILVIFAVQVFAFTVMAIVFSEGVQVNNLGTAIIDVLGIGIRSTQIQTGDNREVIIPNSSIGESQVVNYTYPDSQFRVQPDIGVTNVAFQN